MRSLSVLATAVSSLLLASCNKGDPKPVIVKDELVEVGKQYQVKGSIHNPSKHPMKDVKVRYLVWGKFKGVHDERWGELVAKTGGEALGEIKYLPAGQTVEFTAVGGPEVSPYTSTVPDPLKAEVEAKWAD